MDRSMGGPDGRRLELGILAGDERHAWLRADGDNETPEGTASRPASLPPPELAPGRDQCKHRSVR